MESMVKAIKELMLYALFAMLLEGIFLIFLQILMVVSY